MGLIKIISDGTSALTRVIDEETGNPLLNVKSVTIAIDAESPFVSATLELVGVPLEVVGRTEEPS